MKPRMSLCSIRSAISCKRKCCPECCSNRNRGWGDSPYWACSDGDCIGKDLPPSQYQVKLMPPPFEEVLADIECMSGKASPEQVRGYQAHWEERNAPIVAEVVRHNAQVALNLAALAAKRSV